MKKLILLVLLFSSQLVTAQETEIKAGNKAPSFILREGHTMHSVTMPYMKKIVLLHFWSSTDLVSGLYNHWLKRIAARYKQAAYKNAEGFEIIAIAVQSDAKSWKESIAQDSLHIFTNGFAGKGFNEEVCRKYNILKLPSRILIDENGIILSVDPTMLQLENLLDERRNFKAVNKNIEGILAHSSDKQDVMKFSKVYLFSYYGDSLAKTMTRENGHFTFEEIKLHQDYILKVDNIVDINTTDPTALYTSAGDFVTDGRTRDNGFVFALSPRISTRMVISDHTAEAGEGLEEIDVIKNLVFSDEGRSLTAQDKKELQHIVTRLKTNTSLKLEVITHTDARMSPEPALELTSRQANTLKNYFEMKGISPVRIKAIAKGNSELRKLCNGTIDCREEDHLVNRRVELLVYKD